MELPQRTQRGVAASVTAVRHVALAPRPAVLAVEERGTRDLHGERSPQVAVFVERSAGQ
jgi:hypothetical protein